MNRKENHQSPITNHRSLLIGIDGNEANNVRPGIGARVGVNQYVFGLLHALYKIDRRNSYRIYLEFPPRDDLPKQRPNWEYKVIGSAKFWTQWRLPLELYLSHPRPNVFFTPSHYAPRFCPIPYVVSIMDLGFYRFPEQFTKRDLWQLKSWTEYSVKKAAHILAISQSTKKDIIERYKISPEKITVTYPGYDEEKFKRQISNFKIEKVKKKYGIKRDYILFLGVLKPSKNIEGLLAAYHTLMHDNLGLLLVIAGAKGWLYEQIFRKVQQLKLGGKVVFTGFVEDEDVPALMAGAQVFVLPSFWEGFGIPVLEAMAVGTPVVISNVGSLPEVVGDAGILVDPYDVKSITNGLKKVLSTEKTQYNKLVEEGLKQATKFSWVKAARETLAVLEGVRK